jgi:integrase
MRIEEVLAVEIEKHISALLAETAVRAGELCGLMVDDIDLERGLLVVQRSSWRGTLGSPKTPSSIRVINLSPQCVEHLGNFLRLWRPNQNRLLFATRNGTPWDANLLLKRKFRSILKRLGIDVPPGNSMRFDVRTRRLWIGSRFRCGFDRSGSNTATRVLRLASTLTSSAKMLAVSLGNLGS